ncbi:hypothetical protein D3C78_1537160 [compost metagenome]
MSDQVIDRLMDHSPVIHGQHTVSFQFCINTYNWLAALTQLLDICIIHRIHYNDPAVDIIQRISIRIMFRRRTDDNNLSTLQAGCVRYAFYQIPKIESI